MLRELDDFLVYFVHFYDSKFTRSSRYSLYSLHRLAQESIDLVDLVTHTQINRASINLDNQAPKNVRINLYFLVKINHAPRHTLLLINGVWPGPISFVLDFSIVVSFSRVFLSSGCARAGGRGVSIS